jgi:hypothetical protein
VSLHPAPALAIQALEPGQLPALFAYLDEHLRDNGKNGTPLFQPMARSDSTFVHCRWRHRRSRRLACAP